MSDGSTTSYMDKKITDRVIELTPIDLLENMFGKRESYEIEKSLNINYISNKAFYKLNDDESYYLKVRATLAYESLKEYYSKRAREYLRFDFNKNFGIKEKGSFNLQSLSHFETIDLNDINYIPLKQTIVDKIINSPKFKVDIETHPRSKLAKNYKTAKYYLCEVNKQIVPLMLVEANYPIPGYRPAIYSRSISVFVLLQGKVPFFLSRLDFEPRNTHANKLENGNVTSKKMISETTHQHLYSERFAIIVPSTDSVLSCDTIDHGYLKTFDDAKNFVKNQLNVQHKYNPELEEGFRNQSFLTQSKNKKKNSQRKRNSKQRNSRHQSYE